MEKRREIKPASIMRQRQRLAKRKLIDNEIEELPSILSEEPLSKIPRIELEVNVNGKLNLSVINQSTKEDLLKVLPDTACLIKTRPTSSTFKRYIDHVFFTRQLLGLGEKSGYNFLLETDRVIDALTEHYPLESTRRTMLVSLTSFCGRIAGLETPYTIFGGLSQKLHQTINKTLEKNLLSDRQKNSWLSWKEIMSLLPSISLMPMRDQLIFSLYTENPPRRVKDYSELIIFVSDIESVDITTIPENKNYLVYNNLMEPIGLSIANYKTSKTYGTFRRAIEKNSKLYQCIVNFVGSLPKHDSILFCNRYGEHYHQAYFSFIIGNMLKKATLEILQKEIWATVNIFRHAYVTHLIENQLYKTMELRRLKAYEMGQSLNQQQLYAKYID